MTQEEWFQTYSFYEMLEGIHDKLSERKLRLYACGCCRRVWHLLDAPSTQRVVEISEKIADGKVTLDDLEGAVISAEEASQLIPRPLGPISHASRQNKASFCSTYCAYTAAVCCAYHPRISRSVASAHGMDEYWRVVATSVAGDVYLAAGWEATRNYYVHQRVGMSEKEGTQDEHTIREAAHDHESQQLRSLLRCVVGNPFRPVTIDPACLTPTVLALAQSAYDNRCLPSGHLDNDRLAVLADAVEDAGCDNSDILNHLRSAGPHVRGCFALDLLLEKE